MPPTRSRAADETPLAHPLAQSMKLPLPMFSKLRVQNEEMRAVNPNPRK